MPRLTFPTPTITILTLLTLTLSATGCDDTTTPHDHNEQELITTVELTFSPSAGDPLVFSWSDPEADGDPVVDEVALGSGDYTLAVRFLNALEDPAEDITVEVAEEASEHQVFLTGDAVAGPATSHTDAPLAQDYADEDPEGLPLGLEHTVTASAGSGELVVSLVHLPEQGGAPQKVEGLAGDVADGGLGAIPGDIDASVTFTVTVQ